MLSLVKQDGLNCPVFICDYCGKVIKKAKEANAVWVGGTLSDLATVHKSCDNRELRDSSTQLDVFIWQLLGNVKYAKPSASVLEFYE